MINRIDNIINSEPYSFTIENKNQLFKDAMLDAFNHHLKNNSLFKTFCSNQGINDVGEIDNIDELPYLPVNIFKNKNLISVKKKDISSTIFSSATSGVPSRIDIDNLTSKRQMIVSSKIMSSYLGEKRRPFLIIDEDPTLSRSVEIKARAAATRGFLLLCSEPTYLMDHNKDNLLLNMQRLHDTIDKYLNNDISNSIFGFTYILYNNVINPMIEKNIKLKLPG